MTRFSSIVLVIDRDPKARAQVSRVVKDCGCSAVEAASTDEALDTFAAHHAEIGLVIADARPPQMHGLQLLQRIRAIDARMPVLLLTQPADLSVTRHQGLNVAGVLRRPFTGEELALIVRQAMHPAAVPRLTRPTRREVPRSSRWRRADRTETATHRESSATSPLQAEAADAGVTDASPHHAGARAGSAPPDTRAGASRRRRHHPQPDRLRRRLTTGVAATMAAVAMTTWWWYVTPGQASDRWLVGTPYAGMVGTVGPMPQVHPRRPFAAPRVTPVHAGRAEGGPIVAQHTTAGRGKAARLKSLN